MQLESYLFFEGCCDEALAFYREALGAEVTFLMRYRESPEPKDIPPDAEDKVMHANVRIGESTLMVSDGLCQGDPNFQGFSLCLDVADEATAQRLFSALATGGEVQMPQVPRAASPVF
ncbi:VOC family protein [Geoalkalibacter halelectricus]|uniref:VOC family protein n=1 Tax=Geoalkalibacter halelectricus TaxID=2847045 RepID=A0ABY5ZPP9_9BACT|nr:VOC family protein [Geoalkalibacter halelectricus]MDO3377319.1 VOC family protein [Geoalkalibacter halelectricus]UWZ79191.1 VOC family protein [Geoalkalibacter halelectricus]